MNRIEQYGLVAVLRLGGQCGPPLPADRHGWVFIEGYITLDNSRKYRLQRVVIFLRYRIEFMRVAPGAVGRLPYGNDDPLDRNIARHG